MARELTKKQEGFAKDYAKTGNATLAVKKNHNVSNDNSAAAIGSRALRNVKVVEKIKTIAEQIPDSLLVKKHLQLLNSKKDGQLVRAGLDMAYKIKGTYAPEKFEHSGGIDLISYDKARKLIKGRN